MTVHVIFLEVQSYKYGERFIRIFDVVAVIDWRL